MSKELFTETKAAAKKAMRSTPIDRTKEPNPASLRRAAVKAKKQTKVVKKAAAKPVVKKAVRAPAKKVAAPKPRAPVQKPKRSISSMVGKGAKMQATLDDLKQQVKELDKQIKAFNRVATKGDPDIAGDCAGQVAVTALSATQLMHLIIKNAI